MYVYVCMHVIIILEIIIKSFYLNERVNKMHDVCC